MNIVDLQRAAPFSGGLPHKAFQPAAVAVSLYLSAIRAPPFPFRGGDARCHHFVGTGALEQFLSSPGPLVPWPMPKGAVAPLGALPGSGTADN